MSAHTILLDFTVDPSKTKEESLINTLTSNIENILKNYVRNLIKVHLLRLQNGILKTYTCERDTLVNLRFYDSGLITLSLEYFKNEEDDVLFSFEKVKSLEREICERAEHIEKSRALVPIKRSIYPQYFPTSDERLLEYDIDEIVFDQKSKFQKVQILHSKSLGNMLVLDDLQNLSERDIIYTDTIMRKGTENYKDKEIVILGGGDGALLNELLKEKPKDVLMLEIDEVVIKACSQHLRSLCGDVLDKMSGPNYKIMIADCLVVLDGFIAEGRKFDYVFGDLTDVPISSTDSDVWEFCEKVLQKTFKIMKPNGKLMTQVCGAICTDAMNKYEEILKSQGQKVKYEKTKAFIPSFMEDWIFGYISFEN